MKSERRETGPNIWIFQDGAFSEIKRNQDIITLQDIVQSLLRNTGDIPLHLEHQLTQNKKQSVVKI